ncbi:MAG: terminase large subunit [Thermorudis peleae]|nr:terminase large subunit [Thermorudis peleae]
MQPDDIVVAFVNALRHPRGQSAGQPFALRPWQERVLRAFYGTLRRDGWRQYRTLWLELPRRNGKTTLAAALALYHLVADGEPGAQVVSVAADREQASIVFDTAVAMIRQSPYLSRRLEVYGGTKRIVDPRTSSVYRVLASDADTAHGFDLSAAICDEVHAWKARDLWDVITTSFGSRRQPALIVTTTAGVAGTWQHDLAEYARQVRDGIVDDPTFLPVIYAAPADADWTDETTWRMANPALEDYRDLEELRQFAARAKVVPALERAFRRLYLNQWLAADVEEPWIAPERWRACEERFDPAAFAGCDCFVGLDLSSTTDLSALVLAFPVHDTVYVVPRFWMPAETAIERERRDRVPYLAWAQNGLVTLTPGDAVDYSFIEAEIHQLASRFRLVELAYDRWNAGYLVQRLQDDGLRVVPVGMGFAGMSGPMRYLEHLVATRALRHDGNPVLAWQVANVVVETDAAGNVRPSKKKSRHRIDGVVALLLALSRLMVHRPSLSERGELLVL